MATPAVQHKTLFVLIDGVGDVNIPSLATPAAPLGLTPLQAARTPTLDALASQEDNSQTRACMRAPARLLVQTCSAAAALIWHCDVTLVTRAQVTVCAV